jgi:nitroreductase
MGGVEMNLDIIHKRRSIRRYSNRPVAPELVNELLRAAMSAPSAGNEQPWQFVVISNRDILDRIPALHPHAGMTKEAQVAILVCGDLDREKHQGFWVQDCSAATENLLLAAAGLGLGAVWCGVHPRQDREEGLRLLLGIPHRIVPFALVPIGWPAEEKGSYDRYDAARVHYDSWGMLQK